MRQRVAVGVDLGGTLVRAGIVNEAGALLRQDQASISNIGPTRGLEVIEELIAGLLRDSEGHDVAGIGVGSTGPIHLERGTINNPYTLDGWSDVPIVEQLRNKFRIPVSLENDANAAALGEYWLGAGRGAKRVYVVTVGTGVGTAFILEGVLQRGKDGSHPEGGHQLIDPDGPECYCGQRGCWESLIAGPAIARRARAAAEAAGFKGKAGDEGEGFEARKLSEAARAGDAFANEMIQAVALDLARGIVNIILLFVPDIVVLGGGVMESADLFLPPVRRMIKTEHPMVPFESVRIAQAELGNKAGLYGGAYMILREAI